MRGRGKEEKEGGRQGKGGDAVYKIAIMALFLTAHAQIAFVCPANIYYTATYSKQPEHVLSASRRY